MYVDTQTSLLPISSLSVYSDFLPKNVVVKNVVEDIVSDKHEDDSVFLCSPP